MRSHTTAVEDGMRILALETNIPVPICISHHCGNYHTVLIVLYCMLHCVTMGPIPVDRGWLFRKGLTFPVSIVSRSGRSFWKLNSSSYCRGRWEKSFFLGLVITLEKMSRTNSALLMVSSMGRWTHNRASRSWVSLIWNRRPRVIIFWVWQYQKLLVTGIY